MFTGFTTDWNTFLGGTASAFSQASVVFGIKGVTRPDYNRWVPQENIGQTVWDDAFALAPKSNQQYILSICDELKDLKCIPEGRSQKLPGCLGANDNIISEVGCTLRDFHEWHDNVFPAPTALDVGEANATLFLQRLKAYAAAEGKFDAIGFDSEGKLRYLLLGYTMTLKFFQPEQIKGPVLDIMDQWYQEKAKSAPVGLQSWFQTNLDMAWTVTELGIVEGMFKGLAIALPCAFIVMLWSTLNIALSIFAVFGITCIVAFVLSVAFWLGWSLGIAEAIASVMVIGLSVDYSLHFAKTWSDAPSEGHATKEDRFAYTTKVMGPTVFAASVTTAVSASVMFFCSMLFFVRMATLITVTIAASFAYTLFLFVPLCLVFTTDDPDFGKLNRCCKKSGSAAENAQVATYA
jgi:hypothetical protein